MKAPMIVSATVPTTVPATVARARRQRIPLFTPPIQQGKAMPPSRLLIIEDEPLIRMFLDEALCDAGFQVEAAGRADDGMALLHEGGSVFDAVVVDLGLPDRQGDRFAEEIRAAWPTLPIVIASGQNAARLVSRFVADARVRVIEKPYKIETLCDALATLGVTPGPPG